MEFSENNLEQQNHNQKNRKNLNYSESVQLKRIKDLNMEINPSPETLNIPANAPVPLTSLGDTHTTLQL